MKKREILKQKIENWRNGKSADHSFILSNDASLESCFDFTVKNHPKGDLILFEKSFFILQNSTENVPPAKVPKLDLKFQKKSLQLEGEILYHAQTSGTRSEKPSIVSVPTEAIFSNVECFIRRFEDQKGDPALVLSPFSFDPAILTIFEAVFNCGDLILISRRAILACHQVASALLQNRIRRVFMTPSLALRFTRVKSQKLEHVLLGGEDFPRLEIVKNIFGSSVNFWNIYGVTEASIWTSIVKITRDDYFPIIEKNSLVDGISKITVEKTHNCLEIHVDESRACLVDGKLLRVFETTDVVSYRADEDETIFFEKRKGAAVKRSGKKINLKAMKIALEKALEGIRVLHLHFHNGEILCTVTGTELTGYEIQVAARAESEIPDRIYNFSDVETIPLSKSLKLNTKVLEEEINILRGEEASRVNAELAKSFQMLIEALLRHVSWEINFFEAGGTSIDAMILLNELRPPPEYDARFLKSLRSESIQKCFENLQKLDEV